LKLPRLRPVRELKLLNQHELAEKAGVSRGTIQRLEAGLDARLPTVRKLAAALEVEPSELMGAQGG
jgi:transcriptional regulator with XRE-family HTH domain